MSTRCAGGRRTLVALVAAAALVLAACGGGNGDEAPANGDAADANGNGAQELHFRGHEYEFVPDTASASAGAVTVSFENDGAIEHDFTIEGMDDAHVYAEPGEAASHTFELDAGSYTFYCSIPGHREAGMEGSLEVG